MGEETASQKIEHLGLMFGALAAGVVKGRAVPLTHLTFGLLIFPGVWDWYLQWREQRRGFYTKWEEDMLMVAQALTRSEVGWIRQHPELLKNMRPIEGLIAPEEVEFAAWDWHGACDAFHRHAAKRSKEILDDSASAFVRTFGAASRPGGRSRWRCAGPRPLPR